MIISSGTARLARRVSEKDHPEISRQLQIYGLLFEKATGKRPLRLEVLKGDGDIEKIDYKGEAIGHYIFARIN